MVALTKLQAQRKHAKNRAKERFGINLNAKARQQVVRDIQNNRATFLFRQSNRLSCFLVSIDGVEAAAIYDRQRANIVTLLKPEWAMEIMEAYAAKKETA